MTLRTSLPQPGGFTFLFLSFFMGLLLNTPSCVRAYIIEPYNAFMWRKQTREWGNFIAAMEKVHERGMKKSPCLETFKLVISDDIIWAVLILRRSVHRSSAAIAGIGKRNTSKGLSLMFKSFNGKPAMGWWCGVKNMEDTTHIFHPTPPSHGRFPVVAFITPYSLLSGAVEMCACLHWNFPIWFKVWNYTSATTYVFQLSWIFLP